MDAAKKFAHDYFLSRDIDLRAMIKLANPKKALALTVEKFGRERPVSRYQSRPRTIYFVLTDGKIVERDWAFLGCPRLRGWSLLWSGSAG